MTNKHLTTQPAAHRKETAVMTKATDNKVQEAVGQQSILAADDPFLSTDKIAKLFDVTTETIRSWIEAGTLPGVQINGRWKVRQSAVHRYLNEKYGESQ